MIVPIDLSNPILDDLLRHGRPNRPARPWLGFYAAEIEDRIVIIGVADRGPAQKAGLQAGDVVQAVAGHEPTTLASTVPPHLVARQCRGRGAAAHLPRRPHLRAEGRLLRTQPLLQGAADALRCGWPRAGPRPGDFQNRRSPNPELRNLVDHRLVGDAAQRGALHLRLQARALENFRRLEILDHRPGRRRWRARRRAPGRARRCSRSGRNSPGGR